MILDLTCPTCGHQSEELVKSPDEEVPCPSCPEPHPLMVRVWDKSSRTTIIMTGYSAKNGYSSSKK